VVHVQEEARASKLKQMQGKIREGHRESGKGESSKGVIRERGRGKKEKSKNKRRFRTSICKKYHLPMGIFSAIIPTA